MCAVVYKPGRGAWCQQPHHTERGGAWYQEGLCSWQPNVHRFSRCRRTVIGQLASNCKRLPGNHLACALVVQYCPELRGGSCAGNRKRPTAGNGYYRDEVEWDHRLDWQRVANGRLECTSYPRYVVHSHIFNCCTLICQIMKGRIVKCVMRPP